MIKPRHNQTSNPVPSDALSGRCVPSDALSGRCVPCYKSAVQESFVKNLTIFSSNKQNKQNKYTSSLFHS
jgi:hypothetical protein